MTANVPPEAPRAVRDVFVRSLNEMGGREFSEMAAIAKVPPYIAGCTPTQNSERVADALLQPTPPANTGGEPPQGAVCTVGNGECFEWCGDAKCRAAPRPVTPRQHRTECSFTGELLPIHSCGCNGPATPLCAYCNAEDLGKSLVKHEDTCENPVFATPQVTDAERTVSAKLVERLGREAFVDGAAWQSGTSSKEASDEADRYAATVVRFATSKDGSNG